MSEETVPVRIGEKVVGQATIGHGAMRDSVVIEITDPETRRLFEDANVHLSIWHDLEVTE